MTQKRGEKKRGGECRGEEEDRTSKRRPVERGSKRETKLPRGFSPYRLCGIEIITHPLTYSYPNTAEINTKLSFWFPSHRNNQHGGNMTKKYSKHV